MVREQMVSATRSVEPLNASTHGRLETRTFDKHDRPYTARIPAHPWGEKTRKLRDYRKVAVTWATQRRRPRQAERLTPVVYSWVCARHIWPTG